MEEVSFESRFYINGFYSTYPVGWVDTTATRRLLEAIDQKDKKRALMVAVAISKERGWKKDEIEAYYSQFRNEDIRGCTVMPKMPLRPARPSGPYSHASGARSNVYAPPTGLPGLGPGPTSHPRSVAVADPPSTPVYQSPYSPRSGSNYNPPGSYQGSAYGGSSNTYPIYGAATPPSGYVHGSDATPYGSNQGHSYGTNYPTSTHDPSSSSSQQGRSNRGNGQGRGGSGGAHR